MTRALRTGAVLAAIAAVAAIVVVALLPGGGSDAGRAATAVTAAGSTAGGPALPPASHGALAIPHPAALDDRHLTEWAPVVRAAVALADPRAGARRVAALGTRTPEGTANLVRVLGRRQDARGAVWLRVALAVLPNGTTGWVPRRALGAYETTRTRLVVDLAAERATLYDGTRVLLRVPVGVGRSANPTPRGSFYVRNRLERYASPEYGPLAFGTSARSDTLTDWPAGGYVGIHGTDRPDLIPGRVSHGCIRMRNPDILRLGRLMPVGTPVTIS